MSSSAPRKRADAVTMSDIARLAGVSRPTVSIVLNDRHQAIGIAEATRARDGGGARTGLPAQRSGARGQTAGDAGRTRTEPATARNLVPDRVNYARFDRARAVNLAAQIIAATASVTQCFLMWRLRLLIAQLSILPLENLLAPCASALTLVRLSERLCCGTKPRNESAPFAMLNWVVSSVGRAGDS